MSAFTAATGVSAFIGVTDLSAIMDTEDTAATVATPAGESCLAPKIAAKFLAG
jgi:hypothetical protein